MKILQFGEANDAADIELSCELRSFPFATPFHVSLISRRSVEYIQPQQQNLSYTYVWVCVHVRVFLHVGVSVWVWEAWDVQVLIIYCMLALHSSACEMGGKMPQGGRKDCVTEEAWHCTGIWRVATAALMRHLHITFGQAGARQAAR